MKVSIQKEDFCIDDLLEKLSKRNSGAVVSFLGIVREFSGGEKVEKLEFESYEEVARERLQKIGETAKERFGVEDVLIVHRIGEILPGEKIVLIAVSAAHRNEAFDACRWMIDELKKNVPIFKKEYTEKKSYWV
jgi:molybdopterin synthase catalytic subunit